MASTSVDRLAETTMSEREKMLAGLPYDAMKDADLVYGRLRAKRLVR
jgi:hypothetical protein